jgi:hypothetical protein
MILESNIWVLAMPAVTGVLLLLNSQMTEQGNICVWTLSCVFAQIFLYANIFVYNYLYLHINFFLFVYSYVHTLFGPSPSCPPLSTSPPHPPCFQAESVLPLSRILLKRKCKQ